MQPLCVSTFGETKRLWILAARLICTIHSVDRQYFEAVLITFIYYFVAALAQNAVARDQRPRQYRYPLERGFSPDLLNIFTLDLWQWVRTEENNKDNNNNRSTVCIFPLHKDKNSQNIRE